MKDLIKKTTEDLVKDLREKREALRTFRFGISGGKVKNVKEGKGLRKEIAQILTIMSSRKNQ
ncbi:MAG TPA: 50S ribosomal protein L29 [Candidatus Paceibacterota bacterium]|jgi:ribosomal protein L29|nr:50S ribosomal protein L29 [Candidatus Paceibacterota bacterium]